VSQNNVQSLSGGGGRGGQSIEDGNSVSAFVVATFHCFFSPHCYFSPIDILKAILDRIEFIKPHPSADYDSPPPPSPTSQNVTNNTTHPRYEHNIFLYHAQPLSFETRHSHPRLGKYLSQGQGSIPTIQSAHYQTARGVSFLGV
jgi:hypothetical protein